MRLLFMCVLSHNYLYPNLSEGADRVAGQMRGDKECPFSGVTKYGRVWRKVPESDARRVSRLVKTNLSRHYSQDLSSPEYFAKCDARSLRDVAESDC